MIGVPAVVNFVATRLVWAGTKGRIRSGLVATLRTLARQPWTLPLLTVYVASQLTPLSPVKRSEGKIRLLVLNEERYRPDLDTLKAHPDVELVSLPSSVQNLVNAIWTSDIRDIIEDDPYAYLRNDDPRVARTRQQLFRFLCRLLVGLAKRAGIDGITSCTFYYLQDRDWEAAGRAMGVPFFALHKENMKDPVAHAAAVEWYRTLCFRFTGDRIFLFNRLEKEILLRSGACSEDRISVVGGLRVDAIHRRVTEGRVSAPKRQVVLFSFHHCVGGLKIPGLKGKFNDRRDAGFVEYFDLVHGRLALLAHEHPDISVVIKPKWENQWADQIKAAIRRQTGLEADDISNLRITAAITAQELIEQSAVVVGINSTTLLEAKLYGRPVVLPLFAEAAGKYFDKHVYFHDYLETFNVARSLDELERAILDELDGHAPARSMPRAMVEDYLGYFDGRVCERVVALMKQDIRAARARRN